MVCSVGLQVSYAFDAISKASAQLSISAGRPAAWGAENSDVLIQINNMPALEGHSQMGATSEYPASLFTCAGVL